MLPGARASSWTTCRPSVRPPLPSLLALCPLCALAHPLPPSATAKSFADALAERKTLDRVKQERKERQLENRARRGAADQGGAAGGFSDLSSASKDVLLSGRTGDVRLREKKARPESAARSATTRSATAASASGSSTSAPPRPSAPSVPAMSRPAPLGTSSTSSSSRVPARPVPSPAAAPDDDDLAITNGPARRTRRRDGTYIETVQMGSRDFVAPSDDPTWERVEPYSGIRLRCVLAPPLLASPALEDPH